VVTVAGPDLARVKLAAVPTVVEAEAHAAVAHEDPGVAGEEPPVASTEA
jgi:hypothetical protein